MAYDMFDRITHDEKAHDMNRVSKRVRAQAHSGAVMTAHREFRRLIHKLGEDFDEDEFEPGDMRNPNEWMYKAMDHANACAALGLISRAVVSAGLDYKVYAWDIWPMLEDPRDLSYAPFLNALKEFQAWEEAAERQREKRAEVARVRCRRVWCPGCA